MTAAHSPIPTNSSDMACIDLVNSSYTDHLGGGECVERITEPRWQEWFLDRYALKPKPARPAPLDELVVLRGDVRRILEKWATHDRLGPRDARALDLRIHGVPLRRRVAVTETGLGLREEPLRRDWDWVLAAVSASAVDLVATGDRQRLKVCANPACSWMFYDQTINRSKRYCSTTPCASLLRVRRFRQRD